MQPILDIKKFEEYEEILIQEVIDQIRLKLIERGISGELLHDLTGELAFSFASTLDDNAMIERNGVEVHPFLAFTGPEGEIIHCGENSNVHEFVAGAVHQAFSG